MKQEGVSLYLNELSFLFSKENIEMSKSCEGNGLYLEFVKWLKLNGAVFSSSIKYPTAFGPLGLIGCKSCKEIEGNSALLFIPNKMIISSDSYKSNRKNKSKGVLTNGMKLTLILIEEYIKGIESFWFPYILLILSMDYSSFPVNWNTNQLNALKDKGFLSEIKDFNHEINENYKAIKNLYSNGLNSVERKIPIELFRTFYLFTVSRLFYFTNKTSYLIPLADLLNHNPSADVKYEIFDSINYTMKFTVDLDRKHFIRNLSSYTKCAMFFEENGLNDSRSTYNDIDTNTEVHKPLDINIYSDDCIQLNQTDFFVISTNSNQSFQSNTEVYNNYGKSSNEYLLINFGFCLIDNYYDSSKIQMRLPKGNKVYTDMITNIFQDFEEDENCYSYIVRIKKRKINLKIIDYFRLNYVYENELQSYPFTNQSEVKILINVIEFYNDSIAQDTKSIIDYIEDIKQYANKGDQVNSYIAIYKMTQKMNLIYQKDYVLFLKKLCTDNHDDNALGYRGTVEYYDNILNSYLFELAERSISVKAIRNYLIKWSLLEN